MAEQQTIHIEAMAFGGDGIGRIDGKVCFVPRTIPGETAEIKIVEDKSRYSRGIIIEIAEPSPHRREPFCPVFGICGGCQYQHIAYDRQLSIKREILSDALARLTGGNRPGNLQTAPTVDPVIPSP